MSSAELRTVTLDFASVGFTTATRAIISIRRAGREAILVIIPEYVRIPVRLESGNGSVKLLDNTLGSIYECMLMDAEENVLMQFFFLVNGEDFLLSEAIKYTAWPDGEDDTANDWKWDSGISILWQSGQSLELQS